MEFRAALTVLSLWKSANRVFKAYKTNPVASTSTSTHDLGQWIELELGSSGYIWRSPRLSFQVSESEQRYKSYRSVDYLPLLHYIDPLCVYILWLLNLEWLLYSLILSWDVVFPYTQFLTTGLAIYNSNLGVHPNLIITRDVWLRPSGSSGIWAIFNELHQRRLSQEQFQLYWCRAAE
jgi:hypothetical protein